MDSASAASTTLPAPAIAVTHDAHAALEMNPMDSFFGYALNGAAPTHTSRHDRRLSADVEAPPAYEEGPSPPAPATRALSSSRSVVHVRVGASWSALRYVDRP